MEKAEEKVKKDQPAKDEKKHEKKVEKKKQPLSGQLEDKWVGSRSEAFTRIVAKENEIRSKTSDERRKSERMIEDAKGKAATIRREALMEEVGKEDYKREIEKARKETEDIKLNAEKEAVSVREEGMKNIDKALEFIVTAITTTSS